MNQKEKYVLQLQKKARQRRKDKVFIVEGMKMFQELPKERLLQTFVSESFLRSHGSLLQGISYEIVKDAVKDAIENAEINNVTNTEFYAGDVEIILDELINKKNIVPNVVMVDPPRKGLDKNSVNNIMKIKPRKIVYISCNPATLIRDLACFEELYDIRTITPVDMFPFTSHVEVCALLELKNYQ